MEIEIDMRRRRKAKKWNFCYRHEKISNSIYIEKMGAK
jgi:hypothetical protein